MKQLRSGQPKHQYAFSKPALQECIRAGGDQLQDLRELASTIFTATTAEEGIDVLNSRLIGVCRRLFPVSGARTHCAERQFRIHELKPRKAVPPGSPLAEVWQLCPQAASTFLLRALEPCLGQSGRLPTAVTDCNLALLPKPHKSSRLPRDLRPLGLQDPTAKILAVALKNKILSTALPLLHRYPQYAYTPGKALDEAVCRAVRHCSKVRASLQDSRISVHSRRKGHKGSDCIGGITLTVDLSRAFDQLPRWALAQTLLHAGVEASVIDAIIEVHEHCTYHVRHGSHSGSFPLQVGVRQGCSLSPLLFSLFSCWLCDLLDARVRPGWCADHLTIFADDNLAQWEVGSEHDLNTVCRQIKLLFQLLKDVGMEVNTAKSGLLLKLQGRVAKAWLRHHVRHHRQGSTINVGTPTDPIELPLVSCITYLGIRLSYGGFELQTCQWRIRAAKQVRQRLVRLLHSSGLRVSLRLKLYNACVRSSLCYGQHAIGYSSEVLRRMEASDARWVRAIARSPVHLTRESNRALRGRLRLKTISELQHKLLRGRIKKSLDANAVECFRTHLCTLTELMTVLAAESQSGLLRVEVAKPIACHVCGQYFSNMKHLLSHQARAHASLPKPGKSLPDAMEYGRHAVDGMPQCRHCLALFTRVEALKKHIRRSCPVLYMKEHTQTHPASAGTSHAASSQLGVSSDPVPREDHPEPALPLIQQTAFRQLLASGWKNVLRNPSFRNSLSQYCAVCGQWLDMDGVKQHYRLSHANAWLHKFEASSRCNGLGLTVVSPCLYCGRCVKEPRTHINRCPCLFQASVAELLLRQDRRVQDDRGGPADNCSSRAAGCAGSGPRPESAAGGGEDAPGCALGPGGRLGATPEVVKGASTERLSGQGAFGLGPVAASSGRLVSKRPPSDRHRRF